MGRQISAANAVVSAVIEACGLYRVPVFRMQSRVVNIGDPTDRRGFRPFAIGKWRDEYGQEHSSGMADLLTHPKIHVPTWTLLSSESEIKANPMVHVTVPLWIECKSGRGVMTPDQKDFKRFVEGAGAHHLCVHDCADEVLAWFKSHGVKR